MLLRRCSPGDDAAAPHFVCAHLSLQGPELEAFRDRLKQAEGDVLNANKALQRKDSELQQRKGEAQLARAQEARAAALEEQLAKERARAKELEEGMRGLQGRAAEAEAAAARAGAVEAELEAAKGREAALLVPPLSAPVHSPLPLLCRPAPEPPALPGRSLSVTLQRRPRRVRRGAGRIILRQIARGKPLLRLCAFSPAYAPPIFPSAGRAGAVPGEGGRRVRGAGGAVEAGQRRRGGAYAARALLR